MRFVRASRLVRPGARPHRSRPRLAQLGGGGGAPSLPERTTPPAWRGRDSGTFSNTTATNLNDGVFAGDLNVYLAGATAIGSMTSLDYPGEDNRISGTYAAQTGLGSVWGLYGIRWAGYQTATAVADFNWTPTPAAPSNYLAWHIVMGYNPATVDGNPTCPFITMTDDFTGFAANDSNTATFPTVEVPTGYEALFMGILGARNTTFAITGTGLIAMESLDSFAGTGASLRMSRIQGPVTVSDAKVTIPAGWGTTVSDRHITAAIMLVPGT